MSGEINNDIFGNENMQQTPADNQGLLLLLTEFRKVQEELNDMKQQQQRDSKKLKKLKKKTNKEKNKGKKNKNKKDKKNKKSKKSWEYVAKNSVPMLLSITDTIFKNKFPPKTSHKSGKRNVDDCD